MFVLKMMFVYCRISLCNAVSRVGRKGEGWYIIMAVFSDILYKTSDRACCYHRLLLILLLYSLCMKFQAQLVNFQDQLENRVLCKTFPSRQNSEVHPSVTTHEELKNVF